MSADAVGHVYRYAPRTYNAAEMLALLAIADTVNDQHGNRFWMSMETLAKKTRVNRRTAGRAVARLTEDGWLELLTESSYAPNEYRFLFDDERDVVFDARGGTQTDCQPDHRKARTAKVRTDVPPPPKNEGGTSCHEGGTSVRTNSIELNGTQTNTRDTSLFETSTGTTPSQAMEHTPPTEIELTEPVARSICEDLARRYSNHRGTPLLAVTNTSVADVSKLLRLGPPGVDKSERRPVSCEEILRVVEHVFTRETARTQRGFCWADQIQSGSGLYKKWLQVEPLTRTTSRPAGNVDPMVGPVRARDTAARMRAANNGMTAAEILDRQIAETQPQLTKGNGNP